MMAINVLKLKMCAIFAFPSFEYNIMIYGKNMVILEYIC